MKAREIGPFYFVKLRNDMSLPLELQHRMALLADAPIYFTAAEKFVRCCPHLEPDSFVPLPVFQNDFGQWSGELRFRSDHVLSFREFYRRHGPDLIERVVNMDFRLEHQPTVLFRVDAHGRPVFNGGTEEMGRLHLDLPNIVTYEEGDSRLRGFSLRYFTMVDMIDLIGRHLDGEGMPWA